MVRNLYQNCDRTEEERLEIEDLYFDVFSGKKSIKDIDVYIVMDTMQQIAEDFEITLT